MIARRIQYYHYGGPETMRLEAFDPPALRSGEVMVRVAFAAINPIDWKVREGKLKMMTGRSFPRGFGSDLSGTVIAVGPGVTRFAVGDDVFGCVRLKDSGAIGSIAMAPETFLARKPDAISLEEAACLGTPAVTAWNALVDKAEIEAGDRVFINGATGAVGASAVQIAHMLGAGASGTSSAQERDRACRMGIDPVYDYRTTDLNSLRERFGIVYDTVGNMTAATAFRLLEPTGIFLDNHPTPIKFIRALLNRRYKPIVCTVRAEIMDALAAAADSGQLLLPVVEIAPLPEAIALITAMERGRRLSGKAIVSMS